MSSWPPLALAVWLGVSSASLAAESRPVGQPPAPATVGTGRHLSLDLPARAVRLDGFAPMTQAEQDEALPDRLGRFEDERRRHRLELHLGRASQAGRSPGDAPPLYGEVGIDLDPLAGLSIVPSYRVVLDQGDRPDTGTIDAQVLKLGARIHF